jgi:hypothetical protein
VLVLTGRLTGGAPLEVQNYRDQAETSSATLEVWDRERLIELFAMSPAAGLTGFSDGPLLELLGKSGQGAVTESQIERFSERWLGGSGRIEWKALLEATIVSNRLRQDGRLDLAAFATLCLLRAVWATAHGIDPPSEFALAQADLAISAFASYADELWTARIEEWLDPEAMVRDDIGLIVTYPVQCARLLEILAMLALLNKPESPQIAQWISDFVRSQPGAAHPISDRWAVSLLPITLVLASYDREVCQPYLTEVLRWLGDRYEEDGVGLAGPHADPEEEVAYFLGGALESTERPRQFGSYLATIVLDLSAAIEEHDLYELAYNEITAVDAHPIVSTPRDDIAQYMGRGPGADVPLNTSPKYLESLEGDRWQAAAHHNDDTSAYFLGRIGRLWDHLALSLVTRDRHWVAGLRALLHDARPSADAPIT